VQKGRLSAELVEPGQDNRMVPDIGDFRFELLIYAHDMVAQRIIIPIEKLDVLHDDYWLRNGKAEFEWP
jgi:hypothetical protein